MAADDIFAPGGRLRPELLEDATAAALEAALRLARETRWDNLRSPHIFMGLLAEPDAAVRQWAKHLKAELPTLLAEFQELFHQEEGDPEVVLLMHREFLSDNVLRLLREARARAADHGRTRISTIDLLISLLTVPNSIIAECFERVGYTAAKLTEMAVIAEQQGRPAD